MPLITINDVQKYYGDNHVLKGVSLDIEMGEVVSIIGRSGSGKSTLLRCMNGLEGYQDGSIKHDGHRPGVAGARDQPIGGDGIPEF